MNQYNRSKADRNSLDHEETILGHLLLEKEYEMNEALTYLAGYAKRECKVWEQTESIGSAGFYVGFLAAAGVFLGVGAGPIGMGIGLTAAAIGAGSSWLMRDTAERVGALRRVEWDLHRNYPELRSQISQLVQNGAKPVAIIAAYDRMIFQMFANGIPSDPQAIAGSLNIQMNAAPAETVGSAASMQTLLDLPDDRQTIAVESRNEFIADEAIEVVPAPITMNPSVVSTTATAQSFIPVRAAAAAPDYLARVKNVVKRNMLFFVCGSRGSGKGMAVANLLRWKLEQYPNAIVVAFDPKKDEKEGGYWDHPQIIRHAVDLTYSKKEKWDEQLNDFIDTAHHYLSAADVVSGKHVFILIDEVLSIKKKASKNVYADIEGLIATCVGMGSSKGQHIILVTQSFNAGDAGLSDELVQNMCLIGTFREDEFDRTAKIVKTGRASAVDFDRSAFLNLTRKSPVGRVMCLAGEFIPAPKLENYSSWDRDSNTVINQPVKAPMTAEQLPLEMKAMVLMNQTLFTGEGKVESATDRFQSLLTNALAKALHGDTDAVEAIEHANQLFELGQKEQASEALASYA